MNSLKGKLKKTGQYKLKFECKVFASFDISPGLHKLDFISKLIIFPYRFIKLKKLR